MARGPVHRFSSCFTPPTTVLIDVKLNADDGERPEAGLTGFTLRDEVRRPLAHLERLQNGTVERIEVRSGVPRRVIIERRLTEASR
jgi:hypothetical protein